MTRELPRAAALLLALATLGAVVAGFLLATPPLLAAWRLAVTLLFGLAVGGMALLAIGQLLGNDWLDAVGDELLPMAATLPLLALLALPLLAVPPDPPAAIFGAELTPAREAWFAPGARRLRLALCLLCWLGTVPLIARAHCPRRASALALALTAVSALVASVDWVMLAPPLWWSKLMPFCLAVSQLGGALAIAFLLNLAQRETVERASHRSLASALLALALLTFWVWYAQFLTAWSGNLPAEAAWYAARQGSGTPLLVTAAACQLGGALALVVLHRRRHVLLLASVLLLVAHVAQSLWLLRPARLNPVSGLDLIVVGGIAALWLGWLALISRRYDARRRAIPD